MDREIENLKKRIESLEHVESIQDSTIPGILKLYEYFDGFRNTRKDPNYYPHDPVWIRKEFIEFPEVRKDLVPLLNKLQEEFAQIIKKTEVSSWYSNHLFSEFILYVCKWWCLRLDQKTNELMNMVINIIGFYIIF